MIRIKRLYLNNYKLFSKKDIDFSKKLSVFDGPNGYGKTSIFDAIELLITGEISRVKDCDSIGGGNAYKTVYFAKDPDKNVIIKAEFVDAGDNVDFVLGLVIRSADLKGKSANPKSIFEHIEYYVFQDYEIPLDEWSKYIKNAEEIKRIRNEKFGEQNIEKYTLFHYIRQEDRLSYFKNTESIRSKEIEPFFGLESARKKCDIIRTQSRKLLPLINKVDTELGNKRAVLENNPNKTYGSVKYTLLLDGKHEWDKEQIYFDSDNLEQQLRGYLFEIERLEKFLNYKEIHKSYFAHRKYLEIPDNYREGAIRSLLFIQNESFSIDELEAASQDLSFLVKQNKLIDLQDYLSVDYKRLSNVLKVELSEELLNSVEILRDYSITQDKTQSALNSVLSIRESLYKAHSQLDNRDAICPYCGYDWEDEVLLGEKFELTKGLLLERLNQDGERVASQKDSIKASIEKVTKQIIEKEKALSSIDILEYYQAFKSKAEFSNIIEKAKTLFDIAFDIQTREKGNLKDIDKQYIHLLDTINQISTSFSEDYLSAVDKYNFETIVQTYGLNDEVVSKITSESIDLKKQYVRDQYFKSLAELNKGIKHLEGQMKKLTEMKNQLDEYVNAYEKAITKYEQQILAEIEIPFFLYSSRLLQSYQGGQGVLMQLVDKRLRFTSPGNEHDVLYMMSSGQLSAVALAFSLALNKTYAGDKLKTLFIDDPIQCMDDINMISFVELLRAEFNDCQILLSTHEDDFSRYIRYKYSKYNLDAHSITLKDA